MTEAKLRRIISEILSKDFENVSILAVNLKHDHDHRGEKILRVEVVFDGEMKEEDVRVVAGAARKLRPTLDKIDKDLFPLLSFVSKVDYDRGHGKRASH